MYLLRLRKFSSWHLHAMEKRRVVSPAVLVLAAALGLTACTSPPEEREPSTGHLGLEQTDPAQTAARSNIPAPVQRRPYVPVPQPANMA